LSTATAEIENVAKIWLMFIRSYSGTFNTFCNRSDVATNVHFEQKVEKYYI